MNRRALRSVAIAAVGITAVVFAAGAHDSTATTGSGGSTGLSGSDEQGLLATPAPQPTADPLQLHLPEDVVLAIGVVLGLMVILYAILFWRRAALTLAVAVISLGILFLLGQLLSGVSGVPRFFQSGGFGLSGSGGSGVVETVSTPLPYEPALLLLGIALFGVLVVLFRSGIGDRSGSGDGDVSSDAAAVGRLAGRAADRIRNEAAADNEVYRTWHEMTGLLDVSNPETSTPGEFAAAAVDAGMDPGDVDELTALFEDVRYGRFDASEEYEDRAIAVFRRIENEYTDNGYADGEDAP